MTLDLSSSPCNMALAAFRREGSVWASLPTELLQAVVLQCDLDTVKAARLVCKGWRPVLPPLFQPHIPIHLQPRRLLPPSAHPSMDTPHRSQIIPPTTPSTHIPTATQSANGAAPTPPPCAAVNLLGRLSASLGGRLASDATVVLLLVHTDPGDDITSLTNTSNRSGLCHCASNCRVGRLGGGGGAAGGGAAGGRGAGRALGSYCGSGFLPGAWRLLAGRLGPRRLSRGSLGPSDEDVRETAVQPTSTHGPCTPTEHCASVGKTTTTMPNDPAAAPSAHIPQTRATLGTTPLVETLRFLAQTQQRRLRLEHTLATPTTGLLTSPCNWLDAAGCRNDGDEGGGGGGVDRSPYRLPPPAARLPTVAPAFGPGDLHSPGRSEAGPCPCAAPARHHLRVPGLGAITKLRSLCSLELYGVGFGMGFLRRLSVLTQLTRLCVDQPLPCNAATALSALSSLRSLAVTLTWPLKQEGMRTLAAPVSELEEDDEPAGTPGPVRLVRITDNTDSDLAVISSDNNDNDDTVAAAATPSATVSVATFRHGFDADDEDDGDFGSFDVSSSLLPNHLALTLAHVTPFLTSLSKLTALSDLVLSLRCRHMARSLLPPPALLSAARSSCPTLRRFTFRALPSPSPATLYNWVAADASRAALHAIRNDAVAEGQGVFIWQWLDWHMRPLQPVVAAAAARSDSDDEGDDGHGGGDMATLSPLSSDDPGGPHRAGCGAGGGGVRGGSGGDSRQGVFAEAAVGARFSGGSWLGPCLDAPSALNAVVGGLGGSSVGELVVEDCRLEGGAQYETGGGRGELTPHVAAALRGLRSLQLREVERSLFRRRSVVGGGGGVLGQPAPDRPPPYLSHLLQLPSLTCLHLHTSRPACLDLLLPPAAATSSAHIPSPTRRRHHPYSHNHQQPSSDVAPGTLPTTTSNTAIPASTLGRSGRTTGQRQAGDREQPRRRTRIPPLQYLNLRLRGLAEGDVEEVSEWDEEEEVDSEVWGGDGDLHDAGGGAGDGGGGGWARQKAAHGGRTGPPSAPLSRLAALSGLRCLHLDTYAVLYLCWLPPSLHELNLRHVTVQLPPQYGTMPENDSSPLPAAADGRSTDRPWVPGRRLAVGGEPRWGRWWRRRVPADGGADGDGRADVSDDASSATGLGAVNADVANTQPPLLPYLTHFSASQSALPPLACLLTAVGRDTLEHLTLISCRTSTRPPPFLPYTKRRQLAADLAALTDRCAASLRSLCVVASSNYLPTASTTTCPRDNTRTIIARIWSDDMDDTIAGTGNVDGDEVEVAGGGGECVEEVCFSLRSLRRLQGLCWQLDGGVAAEEAVLAAAVTLRELRTVAVFEAVGPTGQQHLRRMTSLRCLLQLSPEPLMGTPEEDSGRCRVDPPAHWMTQLAPHLPLCMMKRVRL